MRDVIFFGSTILIHIQMLGNSLVFVFLVDGVIIFFREVSRKILSLVAQPPGWLKARGL